MEEKGRKYHIAFFVILAVFFIYCIIIFIDATKIPSYKWTDSYLLNLIPLPILLGMAFFAALKAWSANQRMKRFFIFAAVMVAIIAISCRLRTATGKPTVAAIEGMELDFGTQPF